MLTGLDLFSGIGGITLALSEWVRPVAYCEIEPYAAGVLFSRMFDGSIPIAPIFPDITKLTADILPDIDIIYGGFPCQDISCAGRGAGLGGKRSGLFSEICRLADELRPKFIFVENVPAITSRGGVDVVRQFTQIRYDSRWGCLSAYDMGAPHIRERWFLLASNTDGKRRQQESAGASCNESENERRATEENNELKCLVQDVADPKSERCERTGEAWDGFGQPEHCGQELPDTEGEWRLQCGGIEFKKNGYQKWDIHQWATEPDICRVANGIPLRVDRVKSLGNSVVPSCAEEAFKRLTGIE